MNYFDWTVIFIYIAVLIGMALSITRSHRNIDDYYLAGKRMRWWQSGLSTMATQLGAISFISAPAFVALKEGGGLKWLCYEFGVPLALILVMAVIIPVLHRGRFISIYEYLEKRFDAGTRTLVSILFQLGRGLATAVAVLAGGIILSTALSISVEAAIVLVGVVTIVYDALGGIRVVILSDVLQMFIIVAGIIVCGGAALSITGWDTALSSLSPDRFRIFDFKHWGFSSEGEYAFWPMLIGGFFLYASYYGCDQSQVQRELTVENVDAVKKSLLVNAFGRFPVVLLYCMLGVFVGAVMGSQDSIIKVATSISIDSGSVTGMLQSDPDRMVPLFILAYLPHGIIGFIFVAIMSALMSSLDSGLNSLSAVTMRDIYQKYLRKDASAKHYLIASKICTFFWGVFCVASAIGFLYVGEATRQTTIVLINAVGSLLYGPILAAFLLGMMTRWISSLGVKLGIAGGIIINICFWLLTPLSWLWWNVSGFLAVCVIAVLVSSRVKHRKAILGPDASLEKVSKIKWPVVYLIVVLFFFFIVAVSYFVQNLV